MSLFNNNYTETSLKQMPTLSLAYIGDGVFELLAREHILAKGVDKVASLHRKTVGMTRAEAQAQAALALLPHLTEEEKALFMRGRNAKPHSSPKHATAKEYSLATALETLVGWLWLCQKRERVYDIWRIVAQTAENHEKNT